MKYTNRVQMSMETSFVNFGFTFSKTAEIYFLFPNNN